MMYSDIVVISENLFQILMLDAIMKWEAQFKRPSELFYKHNSMLLWIMKNYAKLDFVNNS